MSSKVVRKRNQFLIDVDQTGTGTTQGTHTWTVTRPTRILGWKFINMSNFSIGDEVGINGYVHGSVNRDAVNLESDYVLDECCQMMSGITDVAHAELVGGGAHGEGVMERHLERKEADELGLLLDYGESISVHIISHLGGAVAANSAAYGRIHGFFIYEELGG